MENHYLFLDFETEGLEIPTDAILEVGFVLTADDPADVKATGQFLCDIGRRPRLNSFVEKMHTDNGLLRDLESGQALPLHSIEQAICAIVDSFKDGRVRLAGSGVDFDRRQIRQHMPNLDARLDYQLMDTSQIRRFLSDICGIELSAPSHEFLQLISHRAFDDAEQARHELLWYRDLMGSLS